MNFQLGSRLSPSLGGAGPLSQLRGELFKTFRQRRSIVSVEEYETDKQVHDSFL